MTSRVDPELFPFLDSCTGEIVIEGITRGYEQSAAKPENMREFRTGLVYEEIVAAKIRSALNKRGVKVKGVPGKCLNISKCWLDQILALTYYGLDRKRSDSLAYLIHAANNNPEWKDNPGIELQKLKEQEYLKRVELFNRAKLTKISSDKQPKRQGIKALIVDDEPIGGSILALYVSPLGECDLVQSGSEAIKAFNTAIDQGENYDLITLDIEMPGMNGHEVLKRIRIIEEERGIDSAKIIMTTATDDAKVIMSAFKEQCDGYLVKPIRKEELMKHLSEHNLLDN